MFLLFKPQYSLVFVGLKEQLMRKVELKILLTLLMKLEMHFMSLDLVYGYVILAFTFWTSVLVYLIVSIPFSNSFMFTDFLKCIAFKLRIHLCS
jgi:hypothetical protein